MNGKTAIALLLLIGSMCAIGLYTKQRKKQIETLESLSQHDSRFSPQRCGVCGKENLAIAFKFSVWGTEEEEREMLREFYAPSAEYKICYPCILKKCGFKPLKK